MQQISTEGVLDLTRLCWQSDQLGIVQEIEIWPYEQMAYALRNIYPGDGWLVGIIGISIFVGYLMQNPFLYKGTGGFRN